MSDTNESHDPTSATTNIEVRYHLKTIQEIHAEYLAQQAWAKAQMQKLWTHFIEKLRQDEFGLEPRRLLNLLGSVEYHRQMFDKSVDEYFEPVDLPTISERSGG